MILGFGFEDSDSDSRIFKILDSGSDSDSRFFQDSDSDSRLPGFDRIRTALVILQRPLSRLHR